MQHYHCVEFLNQPLPHEMFSVILKFLGLSLSLVSLHFFSDSVYVVVHIMHDPLACMVHIMYDPLALVCFFSKMNALKCRTLGVRACANR